MSHADLTSQLSDSTTLLVTGGSGFIGSNFIRHLLEESDFTGRIINADSLTYAGNPESLEDIARAFPDRYVFEKAAICDLPRVEELFEAHAIDAVCHFAAESHVDRSILGPGQPPFASLRSGPKAPSRPSRQKQIPRSLSDFESA